MLSSGDVLWYLAAGVPPAFGISLLHQVIKEARRQPRATSWSGAAWALGAATALATAWAALVVLHGPVWAQILTGLSVMLVAPAWRLLRRWHRRREAQAAERRASMLRHPGRTGSGRGGGDGRR